jgi:hypothetical protein
MEDAAVGGQRHRALLDAGAGAVVDAHHRGTHLERHVHDLVDLLGEHLAERPAEEREVLREHEHLAPIDLAPAGDDAVGVGPLGHVGAAVAGQHVELMERAGVEQVLDALAGEHLPPVVLALDRALRTRGAGLLLAGLQIFESLANRVLRHGAEPRRARFFGPTPGSPDTVASRDARTPPHDPSRAGRPAGVGAIRGSLGGGAHPARLDGGASGPPRGQDPPLGGGVPSPPRGRHHGRCPATGELAERPDCLPAYRDALADVVDEFASRDPEQPCPTFLGTRHRGLVAAPPGPGGRGASHRCPRRRPRCRRPRPGTRSPPTRAADGIDEWATQFLAIRFGQRFGSLPAALAGRSVHLHGTDDPAPADGAEWLIRFAAADGAPDAPAVTVEHAHAKGSVALRGPAEDLLLVLWRRRPLDRADVIGDRPVAEALLDAARF